MPQTRMLLSELQSMLQDSVEKASDVDFTNTRADQAIQGSGQELLTLAPNINRVDTTIELLKDDTKIITTGIVGFAADRVVRAAWIYDDKGVWSDAAVLYLINDMVQGDGSPDAFFYKSLQEHNSSAGTEPGSAGGSGFWEKLAWNRGFKLPLRSYDEVEEDLNNSADTGTPEKLSFPDDEEGRISPASESIFDIRISYNEPLLLKEPGSNTTFNVTGQKPWIPGNSTAATKELNIPEKYVRNLIWFGASAYMDFTDPVSREESESYGRFIAWANGLRGKISRNRGSHMKNRKNFI